MSRTIWGGAAVAMMLAVASGASAQAAAGSLLIDGTSTVRSWTCEAEQFTVKPGPTKGFESGVLAGQPALETLTLSVPVNAIECGNGKMNDHLRNALKAGDHPQVLYTLSSYDIAAAQSGAQVSTVGQLTIAGAERPIRMNVTVTKDATGALRVKGEHEIKMTDFGVKPPTLMLGTLKVGATVTVKFDVPLRAQQVGLAVAGHDGSDSN